MEEFLPILRHTSLFRGMEDSQISAILGCMEAKLRRYRKGEYIFRQGEAVREISLLTEGTLHIQREDYWGNCNILGTIRPGELFAEAYLAPHSGGIGNNVVAVEDSAVLFLDARRILTLCPSACGFHVQVVRNLVFVLCQKNQNLVRKLGHMAHRSTREKLMSYLSEESQRQGARTFGIPFNRQQLADYLSVDRSAMSSELSKMRRDGLIDFDRSTFTLLD